MTSPERLTVRGPEDILGFIPHSLGYWPANSIVAMTLQGRRLGATLRLDLPGPDVLADPAAFAATVCGYLAADGQANGSLLALFTNNGWLSGPGCYDGLIFGLEAALAQAGMPVKDAWYVGDRYWRDVRCSDPSCCPLPGRPLEQIRDSLLSTEMVFRGSSVGPSPEERRAAGPVPGPYVAGVLEAEAVWRAQLDPRRKSRSQFEAVLRQWDAMLRRPDDARPPSVQRDAFLRATLLVPAWRDAVLVMAAAGRPAALAGAEEFGIFSEGEDHPGPLEPAAEETGGATTTSCPPAVGPPSFAMQAGYLHDPHGPDILVPQDLAGTACYGDVLMGQAPRVPQWRTMDSLDLVLEQLAVPGGGSAAAALTLRGWIAWCRGRGSYAAAHLGEALEIEPGYRLAELLLELVRRGSLCGWAARKDAAWQKFGPDAA